MVTPWTKIATCYFLAEIQKTRWKKEVLQGLNSVTLTLTESVKESEVSQSCPTLCDPMGYSVPLSSVHGIFQARVLEWVAISSSRGSSRHRDGTRVSRIAGIFFTIWATREAQAPLLNAKGRYQNFSPHGHRVPPCANLPRLTFRDIFPLVPRKLSFLTKAIWITEKFKFC